MKRLFYLAILLLLPVGAFASKVTLTSEGAFDYGLRTNINNMFTDLYNALYATTYSTALTGNPVAYGFYKDMTVSTDIASTAMTTIIASTAGNTLHVHDLKIMVSGTAATATAIALECSDGTLLASWPIADLVTLVPMGLGVSVSTQAAVTKGAGLGSGCPASTALVLSNVGSLVTTTTHVYVNGTFSYQ